MTAVPLPGSELCVHCGFCLQACPTYLTLDDENDSPRGRIVLMKELARGALAMDDASTRTHLDQCLGCRACETACPSGVPYGSLLEVTRERLALSGGLPLVARGLLFVFARPLLLSLAMFGARVVRDLHIAAMLSRLPGALGFSMAMLDSTRRPAGGRAHAVKPVASRGSVAVLLGCAMEGLFAETNRATERVLATLGYRLSKASGQGCCGALHAHAGLADDARALARTNITAFEASGAEYIAVNSAGCGSAMKEYGHLLDDDPAWRDRAATFAQKVRDVSELVVSAAPVKGAPLAAQVAYDAPCHLHHAQRVQSQPLAMLATAGVNVAPLPDAEHCCGSAGIYSLVQPELSQRILAPKLATIAASGATVVATGNPGCLMQIGAGLLRAGTTVGERVVARHPVELLDQSYAAIAE